MTFKMGYISVVFLGSLVVFIVYVVENRKRLLKIGIAEGFLKRQLAIFGERAKSLVMSSYQLKSLEQIGQD